jgi:hypothetical protein
LADSLLQLLEALAVERNPEFERLKALLSERVNSRGVEDIDLGSAFSVILRVERALRRLISDYRLLEPKNSANCPNDGLTKRAKERASGAGIGEKSKYFSSLEWLTLDELLETLITNSGLKRCLRHPSPNIEARLLDLRRDVVPLRNDLLHFRTVCDLHARIRRSRQHLGFIEQIQVVADG